MSEQKRLRILFDGIEVVETPLGWEDITDVIKRIKATNSLYITCEADLTFKEDGLGSSRVDLQACKLEYSIVSPK